MDVYCEGIIDGYFKDDFGSRGTQFSKGHKPNRSFPLGWRNLPAQTQTLALLFIDHDAIPVCGFSWIHWTVANIDPSLGGLPENASMDLFLLEGVTSWASGLLSPERRLDREEATGFGGCAPPDKDHCYQVTLFALDTHLSLQRGFFLNEMLHAMDNHVLDKAKFTAWYRPKGA